ncbi:hypothetical protein [Scytonema sp. UIC 10036]|uniref:hypothetical protein n=1 Tax=Scytonema sp. UIC 10036 TaxID=2304196 RepID=UPI001FAAA161|nr:hypothetical protein [Scytonema sp. UIC 10036]
MTQTKPIRLRSQRRRFPEYSIPLEELAKRESEKQPRCQKARQLFDKVSSQLLVDYYNWFIIIEPNTGDYFIDPNEEVAAQKARQKYPTSLTVQLYLTKMKSAVYKEYKHSPLVCNRKNS